MAEFNSYTSHNANRLDVEGTVKKIADHSTTCDDAAGGVGGRSA